MSEIEKVREALEGVRGGIFKSTLSYDKNLPIEEQGVEWANSWFNLEKVREAVKSLDSIQLQLEVGEKVYEALINFGEHDRECILAQWHQGRPTEDGGYETEYGYGSRRKWYRNRPIDETPKCECGLDDAITTYQRANGER